MNVYYLTQFLWIRNLGAVLAGSRSFLRLKSRCQSFPGRVSHAPSKLMVPDGQRPPFLITWIHLTTPVFSQHDSWHPPEQVIKRDQDGSYNIFCDLVLEVIVHHFCNILWAAQVRPVLCGRGLHRVWVLGSESHWVQLGSGASNAVKLSDDATLADIFTAVFWDTGHQNHPSTPVLTSSSTETPK